MRSMRGLFAVAVVVATVVGCAGASERDVGFYSWPKFQPYPYTDCAESRRIDALQLRGAANTWICASFLIESNTDRKDLTARFTDWKPEAAALKPDLHVVKVWTQYVGKTPTAIPIPPLPEDLGEIAELIVKDENIGHGYWDKNNHYHPPKTPQILRFDLPARKKKQFWFSCRVPAAAAAGVYRCALEILSGENVLATLPVAIRVEPYALPDSTKLFGIYWRSRLGDIKKNPYTFISRERALEEFRDIKAHGFESISSVASSPEELALLLSLIGKAGLKGPIVFAGCYDQSYAAEECRKRGIDAFFHGHDEPGVDKLVKMAKSIEDHHKKGLKIFTSIQKIYCDRLDAIAALDWANHGHPFSPTTRVLKEFTGFEPLIRRDYTVKHELDTYYGQPWAMDANPVGERLFRGFYLFRSGFDGIFPYAYSVFHKGLPYKEDWRYFPPGTKKRSFRMYCTAYPGDPTPISTLQWEAMREGNHDCRYSELAWSLIESARKHSSHANWRKRLKELLDPFSKHPDITPPAPTQYEVARQGLMNLIADVIKSTGASPKTFARLTQNTRMGFGIDPESKSQAPANLTVPHWHEQSPVVDGVLDGRDGLVWRQAAVIPKMLDTQGKPTKYNTQVKVVRALEYLCVTFICQDPRAKETVANVKIRKRDGKVWRDDCVEIFIMPPGGKYYQFALNIGGYGTDLEGRGKGIAWNSKWTHAVKVSDNAWTAEIRIPLADLRIRPGDKVRANFYREAWQGWNKGFSCWVPTFGGFANTERFGELTIE